MSKYYIPVVTLETTDILAANPQIMSLFKTETEAFEAVLHDLFWETVTLTHVGSPTKIHVPNLSNDWWKIELEVSNALEATAYKFTIIERQVSEINRNEVR